MNSDLEELHLNKSGSSSNWVTILLSLCLIMIFFLRTDINQASLLQMADLVLKVVYVQYLSWRNENKEDFARGHVLLAFCNITILERNREVLRYYQSKVKGVLNTICNLQTHSTRYHIILRCFGLRPLNWRIQKLIFGRTSVSKIQTLKTKFKIGLYPKFSGMV